MSELARGTRSAHHGSGSQKGVCGALCVVALGAAVAAAPAGAAFPGDNGRIVFQTNRAGNPEIYSMSADGTNEVRLTNDPANDRQPAYSPDGRLIAFSTDRDQVGRADSNTDIYVMNPDGTNPRPVTTHTAEVSQPTFSPDGRKIIFVSRAGDQPAIFSINVDGTGRRRLSFNPFPPGGDENPAVSATDGRIFFEGFSGQVTDIFSIGADGVGRVNATNSPDGSHNPSVAPDGGSVLFDRFQSGTRLAVQIFTMSPTGDGQRAITSGATDAHEPAHSPDGRKVVFSSQAEAQGSALFSMNIDGTGSTQLTARSAQFASDLADWGPRPRPTGGADVLHGTSDGNRMCGRGGGDTVIGLGGNDILFGDRCDAPRLAGLQGRAAAPPGGDKLFGGRGNDKLYAGGRGDQLNGGPGRDLLHGGPGPDRFEARDGRRDTIMCGSGRDRVRADARDRLIDCGRP